MGEVWVDPGIGFGKTTPTTSRCCATWPSWSRRRPPPAAPGSLVGTSRKRFLGVLAAAPTPAGRPPRPGGGPPRRLAGHGGRRTGGRGRHGPGPRRGGHGAGGPAVWSCRMKGKWAAGIPPRNFTWVIKDHLAVSERPGGFAVNHRRVRRQEEIIWLRVQGFGRVISLLPVAPQPGRLRRRGPGLGPLPARADRRSPRRSWPPATRTSTTRWPPACASSCTRTSWATGSWGWWPATWSGPTASPTSPRRWPWSSTSSATPWVSPGASSCPSSRACPPATPGPA